MATESGSNNRYEVSFYRWDDEGEPAWSSRITDIDPAGFTAIQTGNFLVFGDSYASNLIAVSLPDGEVLSEYESNKDLYIGHELTTQFLADGVITPGQVVVSEGRFTPRVLGVRRNRVVYCSYYGDEILRYDFKTEVEVVTDIGKHGLECDDSDMSIMLPNSDTVYVADDDEVFVYDSAKEEATGDEIDLRSDIEQIYLDGDLVTIETSAGIHWGRTNTPLGHYQANDDQNWYYIGHSVDGAILLG